MVAIVGLGNPGSEYDSTRHNIGFAVVDAIAGKFNCSFKRGGDDVLVGKFRIQGETHLLVKPQTYMNNSGIAVRGIVNYYKIPLQAVFVVVDDFQIPLGTLRIRMQGSDGGHNGLASIASEMQSNDFPRLRCGIKGESMPLHKQTLAGYVLESFDKSEQKSVHTMVEKARDAVITAVTEGIPSAMNKFNNIIP